MEQLDVSIRLIAPECIDPDSSVNVRRLRDENVVRLTEVMRQIGFLPEHPIMVRPHPGVDSGFEFEVVAGQCRAAAARAVGLEQIPAVVETLTDDEARLRSWHENEHREDLRASEKAQWTKFFFDKFHAEGCSGPDALQAAARELVITVDTARQYWWLAGGTEKVKSLIDSGDLKLGPARVLVESTRMGEAYEADSARIDERVDWYQGLGKDDRGFALSALKTEAKEASVDDLVTSVAQLREFSLGSVTFDLSRDDREALIAHGHAIGLTDLKQILGFVVAQTLRPR